MVILSTPTIPGHEDGNSRPEPALNDGIYLVDSPLHASRNISHPAPTRIRWMFIKLAWSQDPGDAGQFSSKRIICELVRGGLVPPANTDQILKRVSSIVAPSQFVASRLSGSEEEILEVSPGFGLSMKGESAATSIKWFGVEGPATSVKYWSQSVNFLAYAK